MSCVNPRIDIIFKKLFGVEENKDLLISLINSIVSEDDQVCKITLLNPYTLPNFLNEKISIFDIKAQSCKGEYFNIEMQITDEADYDKRALLYWAKTYDKQLSKGDGYSKLRKVVGIHILHFFSIPDSPKYHNTFVVTEKDTGVHHFKDLELHTIELRKFADSNVELQDLASKIKTSLDRWAAFLGRYEILEIGKLPKELDEPEINKAMEVVDIMSLSKQEEEIYEGQLKFIRMEDSAIRKRENDAREEERLKFEEERRVIEQERAERAEERLEFEEERRMISQERSEERLKFEEERRMIGQERAEERRIKEKERAEERLKDEKERADKRLRTARKMLDLGVDIETVCKVTGLEMEIII